MDRHDFIAAMDRIVERVERPGGKDFWDKLSIVSTFFSGVVIAVMIFGVGFFFERQTALREESRADRELKAQELDVVAKFLPYLGDDVTEAEKERTLLLISELASVQVAAAVAKTVAGEAAENALATLAQDEKLSEEARQAVAEALSSLAARTPVVTDCHGDFGLGRSELFRQLDEQERELVLRAVAATGRVQVGPEGRASRASAFLIEPDTIVTVGYLTGLLEIGTDPAVRGQFQPIHHDRCPADTHEIIAALPLGGGPSGILSLALARIEPPVEGPVLSVPDQRQQSVQSGQTVLAVGYPLFNEAHLARLRNPLQTPEAIKRVMVGQIGRVDRRQIEHDAFTAGGTAGSPLLHLASRSVIGVHSAARRTEDGSIGIAAHVKEEALITVLNQLRERTTAKGE